MLRRMENAPQGGQPADTRATPLEPRIAEQARALWEGYGRPEGRDVAIWLEAERQVLGADAKAAQQGRASVDARALKEATTPKHAGLPDGQQASPGTRQAPSARPSRQQPSRPPVAR